MLEDADRKITRLSANGTDFRQSEEFDVEMPADLDQFGRDDSHGTIVGREGLVQLGHGPTDRRPFFQKENGET
jgi:hypothetical protein